MRIQARTKFNSAQRAVSLVPRAVKNAAKKGMNTATKLVLAEAKSNVPEDTKTLKKALGRKVRVYPNAVIGVIGARRDAKGKPRKFAREVTRKGSKTARLAVPGNYIALVERGTRPHAVGKGDSLTRGKKAQTGPMHPGAKANPFMMRSWVAQERAAKAAVVADIPAELRQIALGGKVD